MAHGNSPYNARQSVASLAAKLGQSSHSTAPSFYVLTEPTRQPDILGIAEKLPKTSALVYRHFGSKDKEAMAAKLRQICFARQVNLIIGKDAQLAVACGADGVHFPQSDLEQVALWRARCPEWILTAAVHDEDAIQRANIQPLNAVLLSAIFSSQSPSAETPLGVDKFRKLAKLSKHPVIALGGITQSTAQQLVGSGASGLAGISGVLD